MVLNDRLTTAITQYQQLFSSEAATTTSTASSNTQKATSTDEQQEQNEDKQETEEESTTTTTTTVTTATTTEKKKDSKLDEFNTITPSSSSFLLEGTEPPLSTSFEIGDVDDEDDDLVPVRHPSPGIENQ